jgi:ATP-dependent DNA helicase RecG
VSEKPDFLRLQKALAVEAERGYIDLVGNQYSFSEFLFITFTESSPLENPQDTRQWLELGAKFADYPELSLPQRRSLVTQTRNYLQQLQQKIEQPTELPPPKIPRTTPLTTSEKVALETPLINLKEVSFQRDKLFQRLNLVTVRDLLFYYPRDHIDYARQVPIAYLEPGETVTVVGTVKRCNCFTSPKNKKLTIFDMILRDHSGEIKVSRFFAGNMFTNRGWQEKIKAQYPVGAIVAASGLVKETKYGISLDNPEMEVLDSHGDQIESLKIGRLLPVYSLTEGLPADVVRKAMLASLPAAKQLIDPLPRILINQYSLIGLQEAIAHIHFPVNNEMLGNARRRLVFDEFFYLQLGFLQRRQIQKQNQKSAPFIPQGQLSEDFSKILPFTLTNAQKNVIGEILDDLNSSTPMNRLVQGDVGSGKTVVAVFAILAAIQSGYQAALMAPTEVLAEQHYNKLVNWFNLLHLPVELLTGSTKVSKRREIHSQLETGELPLLVGTHALIEDKVQFNRLGLVVIDEQHRFGVQQRGRLLSKGEAPHVLTMTATPIPRTLALTLHGDLDVSQIDELPPGRQAIQTIILTSRKRKQAYDLIRREVAQGRQAYVIFPLIEESEKLDVKAAVKEYEYLSETVFPDFRIALLHGKMNSLDKQKALDSFRDQEVQIIVSTTVIEVGVDVPNATVMLIENAERFGLSQLHQLRGRVGRGEHKSFCLLMTGSNKTEAMERLTVLEQSQDGFFISEMDMRLRGPGQVLGTRQSGLPDFALASLVEDQEVLVLAREAAEKIILRDATLRDLPAIKKELDLRYEKMLGTDILT